MTSIEPHEHYNTFVIRTIFNENWMFGFACTEMLRKIEKNQLLRLNLEKAQNTWN